MLCWNNNLGVYFPISKNSGHDIMLRVDRFLQNSSPRQHVTKLNNKVRTKREGEILFIEFLEDVEYM